MKTSRTARTLSGLALAAFLVTPLAACGGGEAPAAEKPAAEVGDGGAKRQAAEKPAGEPAGEEPAGEEPAAEEPAAEEPAAQAGEVTAPGTTLAFGEAATFPWDPTGDGETKVTVKVIDVVQGDPAKDLAQFDAESQKALEGQNLWYLHLEVTGDPSDEHSDVSGMEVGLADQDGDEIRQLNVFGDFEPCSATGLAGDGSTVTTCVPFYGGPSQTPAQVLWDDSQTPYDQLDGKPVVWKK